jgi:hypothetical protein
MAIYFYNNKILIRGGQIAMDSRCCCQGQCCCGLSDFATYYATFSAPNCSALDGLVVELRMEIRGVNSVLCEYLTRVNPEWIYDCTNVDIPVEVTLRCNKALEIRPGQNECDRYELEVIYPISSCASTIGYTRVDTGCTCNPLTLVFQDVAPSPSGVDAECACCETPGSAITVTITT